MLDRNDVIDVITKCVGYDPIHAPKASEIIERAWVEHFEQHPTLTRDDVLRAVTTYYSSPSRYWPQPADISSLAKERADRAIGYDPYDRTDPDDAVRVPSTEEHRRKCMAEITQTLGKRFSVPL